MRAFKFLSSSQIEINFKLLEEKERKKHGAEKDQFKLPEERLRQIAVIKGLIDQLKKSLLPDERKALILTGAIWYLRIWIKQESYSGWIGYVSAPKNSILYNGIPAVIGVNDNNKLDLTSRNEALISFRNYLHKNNYLHDIEKNFPKKENETSMIEKISANISHAMNRKLKDINLQSIKEKLLGKHQKTKYLYWQDEIKYNRSILLKQHVNVTEKLGKLVMKDFTNPTPFMGKEDRRRYDIYRNFQENIEIPRIPQNPSFLKPSPAHWSKKTHRDQVEEIILPTINDEFKSLVETNFFKPIKPSFVIKNKMNMETKSTKDEIEERVRRYNVYGMFKAVNEELKQVYNKNVNSINPTFFKRKPSLPVVDKDPENIITHSRKNNVIAKKISVKKR